MTRVTILKQKLRSGQVYRRSELARWSRSVDRHLQVLQQAGVLKKITHGVYYVPKQSVFGSVPPHEKDLVRAFLKDNRFLLTSPNQYNSLGVGTTQLYNQQVVYNHKRHGTVTLGGRSFDFRIKPHFPSRVTEEFLLVDLVNNLSRLAEDWDKVLHNVATKAKGMNARKLAAAVRTYGSARTRSLFQNLLSR